jgi:misacylated tRNA(Ala) deacylase
MEAPYLLDCYTKSFRAKVSKVIDEVYIILEESYFYPTGGGQPYDTGKITKDGEEYDVLFVKKTEDGISHQVSKPGLQVGDSIQGDLDWERRYTHMRYHTAEHIVSGVVERETGAKVTGNHLTTEKARIDFNLEDFDKEKMREYLDKANAIIAEGHEVKLTIEPRVKAEEILKGKLSGLAMGLPAHVTEVRLVEVVDFVTEACGGTHVANTKEIGPLEFIKAESRGKNNRRLKFRLKN